MKGRSRARKNRNMKRAAAPCIALALYMAAGSIALAAATDSREYIEPFEAQDAYNAIPCDSRSELIIITIESEEPVLAVINEPDSVYEEALQPIEETEAAALFHMTASNAASLSSSDQQMLLKLAMAEAEDQGTKGKALVMRVVLNRVASSAWPNNVHDVIYQKSQFEVISNGRYNRVTPDAGCYEALEMVMNGWDESQGAMYFCMYNCKSSWHRNHLTQLFQYKDHVFYK